MEEIKVELDDVMFDLAVHGGLDGNPVLPEGGDLAVYIKKNATVNHQPMVVFTFTVQLPDGSLARAQCPTTLKLFEAVSDCVRGWKDGGYL